MQKLRDLAKTNNPKTDDGFLAFVSEICKAVGMLKLVSWDAIRRERFFLTPQVVFNDFVRMAQLLLDTREQETLRRRKRLLAAGVGDEDSPDSLNTVSYTHLTLPTKRIV